MMSCQRDIRSENASISSRDTWTDKVFLSFNLKDLVNSQPGTIHLLSRGLIKDALEQR